MTPKPIEAVELPMPLANAIAQYLAQRPYIEVHELIAALRQLRPVQPPPAAEAAPESPQ